MNNTKERPIALTVQEVNAVLAGNKTQHRVPVDIEHSVALTYHSLEAGGASPERIDALPFDCPFGDHLWVQEEHRPISWSFEDGEVTIEYRDGKRLHPHYLTEEELETNPNDDYPFAVVEELLARNVPILKDRDCFDFSNPDNLPHWRSADVMPKFASRLLLKVADIRIERLNDISEQDAIAMGVQKLDDTGANKFTMIKGTYHCSRPTAAQIIKDIYKFSDNDDTYFKNGENPWVWVIEFKVVEPSEVSNG